MPGAVSADRGKTKMKNKSFKLIAKLTTVATIVSMFVSVLPASAATPTLMKDTLDRLKISVSAAHVVSMTLPGAGILPATTGAITITYTGFGTLTTTPNVVCGAGTATASLATTVLTITSGGTACSGTLLVGSVTPFTATNPGTSGSKTIALTGNGANLGSANPITASFAIAIVDDDQVTVTASVDPSMTFNVGAQAPAAATCDTTFSGSGGTVALGTLSVSAISSSDVGGVNHICTKASTNAAGGVAVSVRSNNAALKSTSTPADTIPSATAAMAIGTANYGLCASNTVTGLTTTTPAGNAPTRLAPFNASCAADTAAGSVGALTTSAQNVWTTVGPVSNGFYDLVIKAAISGTTPAHNDYADTLTFVATGTF